MKIVVRPMTEDDFTDVLGLQRVCFPPPFPEEHHWQRAHLAAHLQRFSSGQWVALFDGQVVGACSNARISEQVWDRRGSWEETLGDWTLSGHDPEGKVLFGADISVHPAYRGQGVGRALYSARYEYVIDQKLHKYGTGCRLPDFRAWFGAGAPQTGDFQMYVNLVQESKLIDRTLTPLLKMGCTPVCVHANYMQDAESANGAALLEWIP